MAAFDPKPISYAITIPAGSSGFVDIHAEPGTVELITHIRILFFTGHALSCLFVYHMRYIPFYARTVTMFKGDDIIVDMPVNILISPVTTTFLRVDGVNLSTESRVLSVSVDKVQAR